MTLFTSWCSARLRRANPFYDRSVLAHQGGWDEILLVVGPIAVIALLLWRATSRVKRESRQHQDR
ncbi:MAG: hypothetical protein EBZ98_00400 [Actinobacteria bacterium]|nr:hypothetical protein [Actinomycetota bacterium]NBU06205.1 hypothetical protein [Acidimicrobiia bacterium]NBX12435.1 hypothetical protein [Acidimicrobiia bacterium]NDE20108.1 hypothetical protein [Actinomycetota bacterium]NDF69007.1 hypothetical protein [Actinomycetota bacterium]